MVSEAEGGWDVRTALGLAPDSAWRRSRGVFAGWKVRGLPAPMNPGGMRSYIRPADGSGGRRQVSANGGVFTRWSLDGREIFYLQGGSVMAVPVSTAGETVRPGVPVELFRSRALKTSSGNGTSTPMASASLSPSPRRQKKGPCRST